jgi:hypothetical protein
MRAISAKSSALAPYLRGVVRRRGGFGGKKGKD